MAAQVVDAFYEEVAVLTIWPGIMNEEGPNQVAGPLSQTWDILCPFVGICVAPRERSRSTAGSVYQ
jgi:hypothetical protein